ncbi:MAG: hypothetical protein JWO05_3027 [Gemmatimonadetes bacterium]|nr:hypothetical protein [Gemmatimonadota bacterium]
MKWRVVAAAALVTAAACRLPRPAATGIDGLAGDHARVDRLSNAIDSLRIAARIPGLAIAILRDTTVLLARGFGMADVEHQVAVTAETPFNIASVTKTISAVVALRLAENGVLDLDRRMNTFAGFADFCGAARRGGGVFFRDYDCDGPLTLRQVLSMEANGVPGTRFFYNPPSYSWASRPMAEVAGRSFSELTRTLVLEPAGMTHSARIHRSLALPASLAASLAVPYHVDSATGRWLRSDPPAPQGDGAAGGIISTVRDLARFDVALASGRLLSPASRAIMWRPGVGPDGSVLPYGVGWFVKSLEGERLLWHSGLWEGAYSALYLKVPSRGLTMILLANSDGLQWASRLDEAVVERSPFARALLAAFPVSVTP